MLSAANQVCLIRRNARSKVDVARAASFINRVRSIAAAVIIAICVLALPSMANAAITYFASASNPADNGTLDLTVVAVTPPGGMQTGDLVVLIANAR